MTGEKEISELAANRSQIRGTPFVLWPFWWNARANFRYLSSAAGLSHFATGLREASQFHFRQGLI